MREEIKYGKLIGKQGDEYVFLDELFKYEDEFQGAVGTRLVPISKAEYDKRTDIDNLTERYEDIWRETVYTGKTDLGLREWIEMAVNSDGKDEIAFDTSYWNSDMWTQLRALGYTEEEYPVFECTGGGRCFDVNMHWNELYEPELWELIKDYESKESTNKS